MPGLNPNKTVMRFERRKEETATVIRRVPANSQSGQSGSSGSSGSSGNSGTTGGSGN